METTAFNPFTYRKARDIRNSLSSAFALSLAECSIDPVKATAEKLLHQEKNPNYRIYINDRIARYQRCINLIKKYQVEKTVVQAFILWDEELFFEMHEVLEKKWMKAQGQEKAALQGLIRAAGVYVLLNGGKEKGAKKMAEKAVLSLEENQSALHFFPNREFFLATLKKSNVFPAKLNIEKYLQEKATQSK